MKRLLFSVFFLISLFLSPSHLLALSCIEYPINYLLACHERVCDGFKVSERFNGRGGCRTSPQVSSLFRDEGEEIHHYFHLVTDQIESEGIWEIQMPQNCSYQLRNLDIYDEDTKAVCERTNIIQVHDSFSDEILQDKRTHAEKEAQSAKTLDMITLIGSFTAVFSIGGLLPLIITIVYILTRRVDLLPYIPLSFVGQLIIFGIATIYYVFLSEGTILGLGLIVIVVILEIGLLLGAKLNHRYHTLNP